MEKAKPMYHYGNSADALYAYKKSPSDERFLKMKEEMEKAISHSEQNGIQVPPGMFANLGYLNMLENKNNIAREYFKKEKLLYPESTVLMDRLLNKIQISKNDTKDLREDS